MSLQPLARQIADSLARKDYDAARAFLHAVHSHPESPQKERDVPPSLATAPLDASQEVGIWVRGSDQENVFHRDTNRRSEWRLWASNHTIAVTPDRRRIVLLGESAARGYFYDPVFTPAAVLEKILRNLGHDDLEVIDLARSNIGYRGIAKLLDQVELLSPTLVIVFVGNNLNFSNNYSERTRAELAQRIRKAGYRGYLETIQRWRLSVAKDVVSRISVMAKRIGVPVVLVVPETNLVDWREDGALIAPFLTGAEATRWLNIAEEAQIAIDAAEYDIAMALASALITIDKGVSPVGPAILGRCFLHHGRIEKARQLFEEARDIRRALPLICTPGCARATQKVLRSSGEQYGFSIVDFPTLISNRLEGQLADRRIFLDYCHLTSTGIRLLAEALADRVSVILSPESNEDLTGAGDDIGLPLQTDADAHFMAAVHCARWQQSGDLAAWNCAEALRLYPQIAEKVVAYGDSFGDDCPPWLKSSFRNLTGEPGSPTYRYFAEASPLAVTRGRGAFALHMISPVSSGNKVAATDGDPINLLLRMHVPAGQLNSIQVHRAFVSFYDRASRFVPYLDGSRSYNLLIAYRTRATDRGQLVIKLNGIEIVRFQASTNWTSMEVSEIIVRNGRNDFEILWPDLRNDVSSRLSAVVSDIRRNVRPEVLIDFGQLSTLTLTAR
jgi:hypothetical protein